VRVSPPAPWDRDPGLLGVDRTFNALTIDTDTSTSETAVIMANGLAGPVDMRSFDAALNEIATTLVESIARDGEGATKVIRVRVVEAADAGQARAVAKAIANSPLVKTAVHGADPNWGRIAMAMGKCAPGTFDPETVSIRIGPLSVYPGGTDEAQLADLVEILRRDCVDIEIGLGRGKAEAQVWGCDLGPGYVSINASYAT
jgi:glutamate N-acetyltransferase/amino-acid N-acetyltransferase